MPKEFHLLVLFWGKKRENKSQEVLGNRAHCCKLHVVWVSFFFSSVFKLFIFLVPASPVFLTPGGLNKEGVKR